MSRRLLQSEVQAFVTNTLLNVRAGLAAAESQGVSVKMPEMVNFELDIVIDGQTMNETTTTTEKIVSPEKIKNRVEGSQQNTTDEGQQQNTVSDNRNVTQGTSESGQDGTDTTRTYTSYTV